MARSVPRTPRRQCKKRILTNNIFGVDIDVGDKVVLTPYIGAYLSIPLAGTMTVLGNDSKLSCAGVTFGGTAGFTAAFKVGLGSIIADGRYLYDAMPARMNVEGLDAAQSLYRRSSIQGSIGYQIKL